MAGKVKMANRRVFLCPVRWLSILRRLRTRRPMLPRSLWRDPRWWSRFLLHGEYNVRNATHKLFL